MAAAGYRLMGDASHPIAPVMIGDATLAGNVAAALCSDGILVTAFSFPVVPQGSARIRVQISASHTAPQIRRAIASFEKCGREHGII